jgi:hypothetical protein
MRGIVSESGRAGDAALLVGWRRLLHSMLREGAVSSTSVGRRDRGGLVGISSCLCALQSSFLLILNRFRNVGVSELIWRVSRLLTSSRQLSLRPLLPAQSIRCLPVLLPARFRLRTDNTACGWCGGSLQRSTLRTVGLSRRAAPASASTALSRRASACQ